MEKMSVSLAYDDVLIRPGYSEVLPKDVSLASKLTRNISLKIPLISSAMDTVTESSMAMGMGELGGAGVVHKNMSFATQAEEIKKIVQSGCHPVCAAIGVGPSEWERAESLVNAGVEVILIDTAHGHSLGVVEMLKKMKQKYQNKIEVIVGNVATPEACAFLIENGADGIKVGVGPGSICTTRMVAGIGVPQFQAVLDCAPICRSHGVPMIADGGIKYSGDVVKALAAGASAVMVGSLLAGTDRSPGPVLTINGQRYKSYRGMGSLGAMSMGSRDRYGQSDVLEEKKLVPEGVEGMTPYRGTLEQQVHQLMGGLRAGMGYVGAKNLEELVSKAKFVRISTSGLKESHVHDVIITNEAPNYR